MRRVSSGQMWMVGGVVCLLASSSLADEKASVLPTPPPVPPMYRTKVNLPFQQANTNDYLVAFAHQSHFNVIADASNFDATARPLLPESLEGTANSTWSSFTGERQFTWLLESNDSLLLWPEPNVTELARQVADKIDITPPGTATPQAPSTTAAVSPQEAELQALLMPYLSRLAGWEQRQPGFVADIPVAHLPSEVRDKIHGVVQASLLNPELMSHWKLWLTDEFWNTAQLKVFSRMLPVPGRAHRLELVKLVAVGKAFKSGSTFTSIARLDSASNQQ